MPPLIAPIVNGTLSPLTRRQAIRSDPQNGYIVITDVAGTDYGQMAAMANSYSFGGVAYDLETEGGISRLTATDATQNNPIDKWELIGSEERKDLFQNPMWAGQISDAQMSAIRTHLANDDTPEIAFADSALASVAGGVVQRAYARYQAGNDQFENDAYGGGYTLKHTTNVPARWNTPNVTDLNVGAVYSTMQLLTEVTNSLLWVLPIPIGGRLYTKLSLIGLQVSSQSRAYYTAGWRKSRSNEDTVANNRIAITQSYTVELWAADDYRSAV